MDVKTGELTAMATKFKSAFYAEGICKTGAGCIKK
jgi:uncharacterized protein (DUF2237 family)